MGNESGLLHALPGGVSTGAAGKITMFTGLLSAQGTGPGLLLVADPQVADITYLALTLWHPAVAGMAGEEEYMPPLILYCTVNPEIDATDGKVKGAGAQVFAVGVSTGAGG